MKDDSQEEFYVEKILDKKVIDNITYYLLKWYDYDVSESTWEPKQGLGKIRNLIRNYEKKIKTDKVHNEKLVKTRRRMRRKMRSTSCVDSMRSPPSDWQKTPERPLKQRLKSTMLRIYVTDHGVLSA